MAEFRSIHVKIWKDEWFSDLEPDAKLLFMYLCTNQAVSICGMYRLAMKFIVFETGMEQKRVNTILGQFKKDGKVFCADGIVWVKKLRKYQTFDGHANENVRKRIQLDIDDIPMSEIKQAYLAYENGADTSAIPTISPSDTHDKPTADINRDRDRDRDTLKEDISGEKSPPAKKSKSRNSEAHPAVMTFRESAKAFPSKAQWPDIEKTVGEDAAALKLWGEVVAAYILCGWNPRNVYGMLEFFSRKEIPRTNGKNAAPARPVKIITAADVPKLDVPADEHARALELLNRRLRKT